MTLAAPDETRDASHLEPASLGKSERPERASLEWVKTLARMRRRDRKRRPVAHAAFLVLGLISAWASYIAYECRHDGDLAVAFGFGVFTLLWLPLAVAFVLGPLLSLTDWSDRRLLISNALTLAVLSARAVVPDELYWLPLSFFAAACLSLNLDWFIRGPR